MQNASAEGHLVVPDQIVLLAQNETGYANLLQLVSLYHLEPDEYGVNQVTLAQLQQFGEGLIAFTGGLKVALAAYWERVNTRVRNSS